MDIAWEEEFLELNPEDNLHPMSYWSYLRTNSRGSVPAKVAFWVGFRMFSYVRTPTKFTNAISKT